MRSELIRAPKRFIDDHANRDLDTPYVWRQTKVHYFISRWDPAMEELRSDAEYYADGEFGPDAIGDGGALKRSAKALVDAMDCQGVLTLAEYADGLGPWSLKDETEGVSLRNGGEY